MELGKRGAEWLFQVLATDSRSVAPSLRLEPSLTGWPIPVTRNTTAAC